MKKCGWKSLGLALLLMLVFAALVGCSDAGAPAGNAEQPSAAPQTPAPKPEEKKVGEPVVYHLGETINPEQVTNFNPFLPTGNWQPLFDYVFDNLFYFNTVKGELVPRLAAKEGTWGDDLKSYTVKLNLQAKWHDGKPFTADDVVYSYQALRDNKVLDRYQLWGDKRLKEVAKQGEDTIVFTLNDKFPSLPYYLTTVHIVPKHLLEQENPASFLNKTPVGSGPFKLQSVNESAILLVKNPDYHLGAPHIDQLYINRFNNSSTLTLALEKGDIQGSTGTLAMPSVPKLLENPVNKMQVFPGLNTYSVIMNNEKPGLSDPAVRKAIQLALDRKTLIEKGEMNGVFPANPGFLSSVFGEMTLAKLIDDPAYGFNMKEAAAVLEKAGYKKNGKGIYEKDGKALSFVYNMAANAPAQNKEGAMITQWLKEIGIETTVKLVTWPELTNLAMAGDFELLQNGLNTPPDPQAQLEVFHSKMTAPSGTKTPGLNYMRFRDPEVDRWLDEASSADETRRKELYHQVQQRIADQAPISVMYNVGGHIPYRVDVFTGYDENFPVTSALSLKQVKKK